MPILLQGARCIDHRSRSATNNTDLNVPNGLQCQGVRRIYNDTLKPLLNYDHMQIAVLRPRNLRDILTWANLTLPHNMDINSIIKNNKNRTNDIKNFTENPLHTPISRPQLNPANPLRNSNLTLHLSPQ